MLEHLRSGTTPDLTESWRDLWELMQDYYSMGKAGNTSLDLDGAPQLLAALLRECWQYGRQDASEERA